MASSSQSIIIEDSPVKQTPSCKEALTIDAAKVDLLSSYTQLMFYLFKASIDFGDKDKKKHEKKHPVQLQAISEHSMTKAKKFVLALCSPDIIQSITVVPRLIEALETNDYKNNLMREFTVFLSMKKEVSGFKLFIQGMVRDVLRAKTVIEKYQISLMSKTQEDDDDVIWISDSEEETKPQSKIEPMNTKTATGLLGKKTDNAIDAKKIVPMVLMRTAVLLGFSQAEVQKVYDEQYMSEDSRIDELDFMNKLRQSRLNIRSGLISEYSDTTDEGETRTFGSVSSQNDVVIIDFDEERMSIGPVTNEDTPPQKMETSPASGLKKYGQMFNTHQFDSSATEKENKVKRISALIAAMPSSQKSDAMDQLSKIQATRGVNAKANNKDTQEDSNKPSTLEKPQTATTEIKDANKTGANILPTSKATKSSTENKDVNKTGPNILLKNVPTGQATMKLMEAPSNLQASKATKATTEIKDANKAGPNSLLKNVPTGQATMKLIEVPKQSMTKMRNPNSVYKALSKEHAKRMTRPQSKEPKKATNQTSVENKEPAKTLITSSAMEISPSDFIPLSSLKTLRNQLSEVHPSQRPKFKKNQLRKNNFSRFISSPDKNSSRQHNKQHKLNTQLVNCTLAETIKTNSDQNQPQTSILGAYNRNTTGMNQSGNPQLNQPQPVDPQFKIPINNLQGNQSTTNVGNSNSNLRYIVIDGSNVAREHGNQLGRDQFSSRGIKLVVDYFVKRGHTEVKAFIPRFRRGTSDQNCPTLEPEILDELEKSHNLVYTPSRYVQNKLIIPYDDRFIIKSAEHYNAIIVSNDNYRDLMQESREWKRLIETNLLQYSFVGDLFLIADDPMGRKGPKLNELLTCNPKNNNNANERNNIYTKNFTSNNNNNNRSNAPNKQQEHQSKSTQALRLTPLSPTGFSGKPRSQEETSVLYKKLSEVFPGRIDAIRKLLKDYPHGFDITFFSHKLLSS